MLGAPIAVCTLAAAPGGAAAAAATLQLSPDTMHQCRLATEQLVLVALAHNPAAASSNSSSSSRVSSASPARGTAVSTFAPVQSTSPAAATALQPADLWAVHAAAGYLLPTLATDSSSKPACSSSSTGGPTPASPTDAAAAKPPPTPAAAAAAAGVQAGGCLGQRLVPALVRPAGKLPRGAAAASQAVLEALGSPALGQQLLLYGPPSAGPGPVVQSCQQLVLTICRPPPTTAAPNPSGSSSSGSGSSSSTAASPAQQHKGTPSSKQKPGRPGTPSSSSKGGKPGGTAPGSSTFVGLKASEAAAEWQARLLAAGVDWSNPEAQQVLQRVAAAHLQGLLLLQGSIVFLPLLGQRLACMVTSVASNSASSAVAVDDAAHPGSVWRVTGDTQVTLVPPSEAVGDESTSAAAGSSKATVRGGGPAGQEASGLAAQVAAARAAAEEDANNSSGSAAAADAAERAVRAGAAALSRGWSSLGGISRYLDPLRQLVVLPLQAPHLFARYCIRPPRGVLLHGPPGSGKTVLAKAAAAEAGATLLVVNGPDIVSEYFGESEAGLRGVFAAARALAPSVIFIDEIDAVAPSRGASSSGGGSGHLAAAGGAGAAAGEAAGRLLTQLLVCMDGISSSASGGNSGGASAAAKGVPGAAASPTVQQQQQHGSAQQQQDSAKSDRVVVIAATNRPGALDAALRRPGRFERELEVGVPSPAERLEILRSRLRTMHHNLTSEQQQAVVAAAHGFVSADLMSLCNEAALHALRRYVMIQEAPPAEPQQPQPPPQQQQRQQEEEEVTSTPPEAAAGAGDVPDNNAPQQQQQQQLVVTMDDFAAARARVAPSALRDVAVEVPKVKWEDVGGLDHIKQQLKEAVEWPQQHPDALARLGATAPRGILLYGPPGCSKTLLARAVAASAGLNFLSIKGGELYSKYVGESERAVAALFARARAAAPSVVFFDEMDGLAGSRGGAGGSGGVGDRVLAQLLMELDGIQPRLGVVVLGATNRPDNVDPALLRPGRFDRLLYVPPPDAAGRQEILKVQLRRTPVAPDVDLEILAGDTEGYTGADLAAVVREAGMAALQEDIEAVEVAQRHFLAALQQVPPSVPPGGEQQEQQLEMYRAFQRQAPPLS